MHERPLHRSAVKTQSVSNGLFAVQNVVSYWDQTVGNLGSQDKSKPEAILKTWFNHVYLLGILILFF